MEPKVLEQITKDVLATLKLPAEKTDEVARYVKRAVNHILIFCNRPDLPLPLYDVVAQIAEDMLKADVVVSAPQEVQSIARGNTSISYKDKAALTAGAVSFTKNYEQQLTKFKRMRLPEDRP